MFSVAQRDALRERVLRLGQEDPAVVAGAVVGSLAAGTADEFSDLDLTFAVATPASVAWVLDAWTTQLVSEDEAVRLVDLARGATMYRVFLLPECLQLDLSMSPASHFRPLGPRFSLVFGQVAASPPENPSVGSLFIDTPALPEDVFGWGVIYALHARACIERGRLWQAEHYVSAVRDHTLSLACLRMGITAVQARGYDDLPGTLLSRLEPTLVGTLEPGRLRQALAAAVDMLLSEGMEAELPTCNLIASRLSALV